MHERLLDEDIRCGRRDLFASSVDSVDTARLFRTAKPREYERACRALAMFDVLGCYVERGYIDKPIVLDEWGHTYAQVWLKGQYIVSLRLEDDKGLWSAWPHFQTFGEEASRWAAGRRRGLVRQEVQRDA